MGQQKVQKPRHVILMKVLKYFKYIRKYDYNEKNLEII